MSVSQRSLKAGTAVAIGTVAVNGPVFALLFGPAVVASKLGHENSLAWVLALSFLAAWAWWSVAVPRWRLWAYERVASTGDVREKAIAAGLLWPRGSFFERTELQSAAQRKRQQQLEREFP